MCLTDPQEHAGHLAQTAATHFAGQLVSSMSPVETLRALVLEDPAYDVVARRFADISSALKAGVGSLASEQSLGGQRHTCSLYSPLLPLPVTHAPGHPNIVPALPLPLTDPAASCLNS